ncbi:MAG TPA: hypothetical protein VH391_10145 [Solirubrobacterales bacterium]
MSGGPKRALIVIAVVAVAALGAAGPAQATFPGSNGEIAFSQGDLLPPIGGEPGDL